MTNRTDWLNYFSNLHRNTDLNLVDDFTLHTGFDLKHRNVLPTFFTGDIAGKGKIVLLSINPKYTQYATEAEQGLGEIDFEDIQDIDYRNWFNKCLQRFIYYQELDEGLHKTFYNFYKLLRPESEWPSGSNKMKNVEMLRFMQERVINIDWIPYYSQNASMIDLQRIPERLKTLTETWTEAVKDIIQSQQPQFVFLHGGLGNYQGFIEEFTDIRLSNPPAIENLAVRSGTCDLYKGGKVFGCTAPVYYLTNNLLNLNEYERVHGQLFKG
jgi:hypothetical protein